MPLDRPTRTCHLLQWAYPVLHRFVANYGWITDCLSASFDKRQVPLSLICVRRNLLLLIFSNHVFCNQFGLEAADRIEINEDRLRIVLRFVAGTTWLAGYDKRAFARG